jgi:hypothetical protein
VSAYESEKDEIQCFHWSEPHFKPAAAPFLNKQGYYCQLLGRTGLLEGCISVFVGYAQGRSILKARKVKTHESICSHF